MLAILLFASPSRLRNISLLCTFQVLIDNWIAIFFINLVYYLHFLKEQITWELFHEWEKDGKKIPICLYMQKWSIKLFVYNPSTSLCFVLCFSTGGKFIYATKAGRQESKHRLVSAKECGPKCVELYYFMEKFKKSELRLLARKGNDGAEDRVWFSSGEGSKLGEWTRAVVEINAEEENCFRVMFKLSG